MIPAAFEYVRAGSAEEAISLIGEHGDEAKFLAGGHSLIPLMKLRLAQPTVLVDIGRVSDLSYIRDGGDHVAIGALTRHMDIENSDLLRSEVPLLAHAAHHVGDPALTRRAEALGMTVAPQQGAGLGERMARALADALDSHARALLVGCDCPVLDQTYLALADDHLRRGRVVLGASEDGGFVLIGGSAARVWRPDLFDAVRLGGGYALADTLVALNDVDGVEVLPPLWDVDRPEDVARARQLGVLP